jgi:ATP-dependent helicase/nuclease subunit A
VTTPAPPLFAFRRNLVLAASAGTGKTYTLVGVLVHLMLGASELETNAGEPGTLHRPIDPNRIVATTFSRKAAAEIRSRVAVELEHLATGDPRARYRLHLGEACRRAEITPWPDAEVARRARKALDRLAYARIGTLHGFATTLVKAHALELGLSPGFELADENEIAEGALEVVRRVLAARAEEDPAAVRELVRATGSVDRLVEEIARALGRLDEDGQGPEALVIDTSDEAELDRILGETVDHARLLSSDAKSGGVASSVVVAWERVQSTLRADGAATDDAAIDALERAVREFCQLRSSKGQSELLQTFFEFRKSMLPGKKSNESNPAKGERLARSWRMRREFAVRARAAQEILVTSSRALARERQRSGVLGFGDVLRAARDLLRDHPHVAGEIGEGLDALLVDEFQDTSRLQREIVELLWEKEPRRRVAGTLPGLDRVRPHGLFVVGDRKQSIYGFRGADVSVFAELCVGLAGRHARQALGIVAGTVHEPASPLADFVPLRHNRRGRDELLEFANAFSRACLVSSGASLFEVSYVPETEDLLPPPERVALRASGPDASSPRVPCTTWLRVPLGTKPKSSRMAEAFAIAERAARILEAGKPLVLGRKPTPRDLAVLARSNLMLEATAYALAEAGIPYVIAGRGFYSAREVRDMMAMLALVLRPKDELALLTVLRGPWGGVRDTTLIGLTDPHHGLAAADDAWESGARRSLIGREDKDRVREVMSVVTRLRRNLDRLSPASILREAVRSLALEETLVQLPRGVQRVANVRKLVTLAEKETSAAALLDRLTRAAEREQAETEAATFSEDDDAVRLLTVHASKGLDFPIVFLPEIAADGARAESHALLIETGHAGAPSRLSVRIADAAGNRLESLEYARVREVAKARDRAERARLAYVAVTRASEAMYLVGDRRAPKGGPSEAYESSIVHILDQMAASEATRDAAQLAVEDVAATRVPAPPTGRATAGVVPHVPPAPLAALLAGGRSTPRWRSLAIATTTLQDFHHCARRFQLVHLLDLPERDLPPLVVPGAERDPDAITIESPRIDARAEGTLAHRVLERIEPRFLGTDAAATEATRLLERDGLARTHPAHARIVGRLAKFFAGAYATRLAGERARILREQAFVVELEDDEGRVVALKGTIDLLAVWPDGLVDVIDYKRARGPSPEPYAFQLDVYTLAAHAIEPAAREVRSGIVFLGGDPAEPRWRAPSDVKAVRHALAALGGRLVEARWSEVFPRVPILKCRTIRCGYVGLCHPTVRPTQLGLFMADAAPDE